MLPAARIATGIITTCEIITVAAANGPGLRCPGAAAIRMLRHRQQCGIGEMEQHQGYAGDPAAAYGGNRMANPGRRGVDAASMPQAASSSISPPRIASQGDQGKQRGTGHQNENAPMPQYQA